MQSAGSPKEREAARLRVLLVGFEASPGLELAAMLGEGPGPPFEAVSAPGLEAGLRALRERPPDAVLLSLPRLPRAGWSQLRRVLDASEAALAGPVVVVTEEPETFDARPLQIGAQDQLLRREITPALLKRSLLHAVERHRGQGELTLERRRERFFARHDSLTGLPNRWSLQEHLRAALVEAERRGTKLAVLFVDLDGFKSINDTLGHGAGDELLRQFAERMSEVVGASGLVARLGGDEFVVAVEDVEDVYALASVTEGIRAELAKPFRVAGRECWVTASIGIALFPRDGTDPEPLISSADTAMYHAKSLGPNQFNFFDEEMVSRSKERFQLVNNLHQAIERGELVIHYQPQVDVGLRAIVGAEALVRWRHPTRGLVSPGDFIEIAEETGMIMPIGEWVLRAACTDAVRWNLPRQAPFRVAVNVSSRQLHQHGFSQEVACILAETGLDPGRLEIEITETSALGASEATRSTLKSLRKLGVTVAIDDFGTGYSSLTLLKELPLDILKIDQSFVRGSEMPGPQEVIVAGLIKMARGLGIATVAEGVETREQLQSLYAKGCHRMQGYLFGKPVPAGELAGLLSSQEAPFQDEIEAAGLDL